MTRSNLLEALKQVLAQEDSTAGPAEVRDNNLYTTTTDKRLQRLISIVYTVF